MCSAYHFSASFLGTCNALLLLLLPLRPLELCLLASQRLAPGLLLRSVGSALALGACVGAARGPRSAQTVAVRSKHRSAGGGTAPERRDLGGGVVQQRSALELLRDVCVDVRCEGLKLCALTRLLGLRCDLRRLCLRLGSLGRRRRSLAPLSRKRGFVQRVSPSPVPSAPLDHRRRPVPACDHPPHGPPACQALGNQRGLLALLLGASAALTLRQPFHGLHEALAAGYGHSRARGAPACAAA